MARQKDTFFPLPGGEVSTYGATGYTCVEDNFRIRNNPDDAQGLFTPKSFPQDSSGFGFREKTGVGREYGSNADTTAVTPRKRPDYGGIY